ncbi:MAG: SPFH domain-containing protein [Selenomonadaceae bacterium]|nr:SPFH domain-containing protein [Selenomonadaceae bacterium]
MGLIKAALGAAGGVLADQWKEFFVCESLDADTLLAKGEKRTSSHGRSSNTDGEDNVISNGSVISVADGQCALIVESGKVVELTAEPGAYTYNNSTEPSIFTGDLGQGVRDIFAQIGRRFTFGGDAGKDQRVYYINTKEITGNKYGTPSDVPFSVVDAASGLRLLVRIRCFGQYSYRITNPILFYTNVAGNAEDFYTRDTLDSQLKTELFYDHRVHRRPHLRRPLRLWRAKVPHRPDEQRPPRRRRDGLPERGQLQADRRGRHLPLHPHHALQQGQVQARRLSCW